MVKLQDLLEKVLKKKNLGYKLHRAVLQRGSVCYFEKSMDITKQDIEIARSILNILCIKTREDLFLGLSCIVMISAYEKRQKIINENHNNKVKKQENEKKLYINKKFVNVLLAQALENDVDFSFCIKNDAKNIPVTYITVAGVQFSFHNTDSQEVLQLAEAYGLPQIQEQEWDRSISFQNGAKEVFKFATHLKNLTDLDYIGGPVQDYLESVNYEEFAK